MKFFFALLTLASCKKMLTHFLHGGSTETLVENHSIATDNTHKKDESLKLKQKSATKAAACAEKTGGTNSAECECGKSTCTAGQYCNKLEADGSECSSVPFACTETMGGQNNIKCMCDEDMCDEEYQYCTAAAAQGFECATFVEDLQNCASIKIGGDGANLTSSTKDFWEDNIIGTYNQKNSSGGKAKFTHSNGDWRINILLRSVKVGPYQYRVCIHNDNSTEKCAIKSKWQKEGEAKYSSDLQVANELPGQATIDYTTSCELTIAFDAIASP